MARLRIRIELSKNGLGVPLHKVASVVSKSQRFLDLLGEDIRIDRDKGEWLGFDFDRESLNFTAEYIGAVTPQQVQAFNAAFDGTTSLRRDTIAQFASITDAIGEDEIIGFGLYPSDEVEEPTDWRCLSRRDALRIAEGIQMLLESDRESHLPAVGDPQLGARIFGERREGTIGAEYAREFEKTLSERMDRVENQMERHSELIQNLHAHSVSTETSVRNLLTTVESFCNQATRRIEMATPLPLPAAPLPIEAPKRSPRWWLLAGAAAGILLLAALVLIPASRPPAAAKNEPPSKVDASVKPKPQPAPETAPDSMATSGAPVQSKRPLRIELAATEPTWVSIVDSEGTRLLSQVLNPENQPRALELSKDATLVTGNAGGLLVRVNGEQLSSLGGVGQVRQLHFKDGQVQRSEK